MYVERGGVEWRGEGYVVERKRGGVWMFWVGWKGGDDARRGDGGEGGYFGRGGRKGDEMSMSM